MVDFSIREVDSIGLQQRLNFFLWDFHVKFYEENLVTSKENLQNMGLDQTSIILIELKWISMDFLKDQIDHNNLKIYFSF